MRSCASSDQRCPADVAHHPGTKGDAMTLGEDFGAILDAARTGAEWALASLYQDLHPPLLRYLKAHEPREAEDLASETWLQAAAALPRFEGGEREFRKWMFTIARRRLVDLRRRNSRHRTNVVPIEDLIELPDAGDVEVQAVDTVTAQAAIQRLVEVLPADQAEVVLLRVVGGLTAEETGEVMGKKPGTIRVLQHRALERLARDFAEAAVTGSPPQAI
jgi:RNA polymerase sigma-70 factor, ECF subfamily